MAVEVEIYRNNACVDLFTEAIARSSRTSDDTSEVFVADKQFEPWPYRRVSADEMVMWTYFLPTEKIFSAKALVAVQKELQRLNAPDEVVQEVSWAQKYVGFEEYMVRSPEWIHRDPLLLGRLGKSWYMLARWGESLLPIKQIQSVVEQSFKVRTRYTKRFWTIVGSFTIFFSAMCAVLVKDVSPSAVIGMGSLSITSSMIISFLIFLGSPYNVQQHFLDKYR